MKMELNRSDICTKGSITFGSVLHECARLGLDVEKVLHLTDNTDIIEMCTDDSSVEEIVDYLTKDLGVSKSSRGYSKRVSKLAGQFYFRMHTLHGVSVEELEKHAPFELFEKNFTTIAVFEYDRTWENIVEGNDIVIRNDENLEEIIKSETSQDYEEELFE